LEGRRTGRPPGSKSTPPWVRDARWAYKHLGEPDAVPPSALAGLLVALGREHPERLLACLAIVEARGSKPSGPVGDKPQEGAVPPAAAQPDGNGTATALKAGGGPRRVKTLFIPQDHLAAHFHGNRRLPWVPDLPYGSRVVACDVDAERGGVVFIIGDS
jgi:hypothetical protein